MAVAKGLDLVLGIVMIVLGVLLLLGKFSVLGPLIFVTAVGLIIVGALMVIKTLPGGVLIGIVVIVLGAALLAFRGLPKELDWLTNILDVVIGVLLLVFGIMKTMGR